jgi:hypothetical protein
MQMNGDAVTRVEIAGDLEDPHIVFTSGKGDIRGQIHTGTPFVEARIERLPANISSSEFSEIRVFSPGGVRIRGFHVKNS